MDQGDVLRVATAILVARHDALTAEVIMENTLHPDRVMAMNQARAAITAMGLPDLRRMITNTVNQANVKIAEAKADADNFRWEAHDAKYQLEMFLKYPNVGYATPEGFKYLSGDEYNGMLDDEYNARFDEGGSEYEEEYE